ncbi:hypothetical protein [Dysgonomonas sp. HGC4]|nr:hypothetical protein [Dysgonomonas sp. HGC4]
MKKILVIVFISSLLLSCKSSSKACGCPYGSIHTPSSEYLAQK